MRTLHEYFTRKGREIALLDRCLCTPLEPILPTSVADAIELKFRLAALLKAEQNIERWSITETARPPARWRKAGPFAFNFGYQRADLDVRGPPIYGLLEGLSSRCYESTIYAGSGMSAIAALVIAALQLSDTVEVVAAADCYVETKELLASLSPRIRIVPFPACLRSAVNNTPRARILWLDSSVRRSFSWTISAISPQFDLVVLDTTCFWRDSSKVDRTVQRAVQIGVPIVLVRSHAKLDTLGIEYGRLGSAVVMTPKSGGASARSRWTKGLVPKLRDAVRLFGAAPVLANFPPFESGAEYRACSMARTASIIRSSHRLARVLASRLPWIKLTTFQHGLYLLMALGDPSMEEVRRAADELATDVAARGLPIKHAGSFGFDFVGVEWCVDPIDQSNSIRISGADLPLELTDAIGHAIADWWWGRGAEQLRHAVPPASAVLRAGNAMPV